MRHEFMGEVIEVGRGVNRDKPQVGDRVVVPFPIACGAYAACRAERDSYCENSNPNAGRYDTIWNPSSGSTPGGRLGTSNWNKAGHRLFSHITMNWRGRPLASHEVIVQAIAATTDAGAPAG
jgi:hypothetical protein